MSQGNTAVPVQAQEQACPIGEVLDHISGKWTVGIITACAVGPARFTELERAIEGISRRILTLNLRKLERDGLLVRTVYPTVPPKVEYRLTPIARELGESFAHLTAWAERHRRAIAAARTAYDRQDTGERGDSKLEPEPPSSRWRRPDAALYEGHARIS